MEFDLRQICRVEIFIFSERHISTSGTRQELIDSSRLQISAWCVAGNNGHRTEVTTMTAALIRYKSGFRFGHRNVSWVATRRSKSIRRQLQLTSNAKRRDGNSSSSISCLLDEQ